MLKKDIKSINNKYLKKQLLIIAIISMYFLSLSFVFGRYALKKINTYLSASKEFYFYSDKLSDKEIEYPINWSGTQECIIPIKLYTKLNNLKKANHDIKYKVEYELLSNNASCKLSKESGVVTAEENEDAFEVSVIPNSVIENDEKIYVRVIVSTVDDFEKILTAKFAISLNNEDVLYEIEDKSDRAYFRLIINNMKKEKITVSFNPNEVIVDTTNDIFKTLDNYEFLNGTKYLNKIEFTLDALSNIDIKFFKIDKSKNYSDNKNVITLEHEQL